MKLSKVNRLMKLFSLKDISEYHIATYDPNRVPNTHFSNGNGVKKCQVSLMMDTGDIITLKQGSNTRREAEKEGVLAVFMEYHHLNQKEETIKYQKTILIK